MSAIGYWRDSARSARFFMVDAYSAFPIVLFLLHIRLWTFLLAIVTIIFFAILERFDFTLQVFLKLLRSTIAGPVRLASAPWRE